MDSESKEDSQTTVPLPHFDKEKWPKIEKILQLFTQGKIQTYPEFQEHLLELYNLFLKTPIKSLGSLEKFFFMKGMKQENDQEFYISTLPFLANLALELPVLFPKELPILKQNTSNSLTFTKRQVACLIIHMFFGTIKRNKMIDKMHGLINFQCFLTHRNKIMYEKLCCLFNYFARLEKKTIDLTLNVSYIRLQAQTNTLKYWKNSEKLLQNVTIMDKGGIEDFTENSIQVDFANKYIGGGALVEAAVQEEIRFIVSPECFPSMIIFEHFLDDEVGYIIGTEQISKYIGYGEDFEYYGDFIEKEPKIDNITRRLDVNILALDALCFWVPNKDEQFQEDSLLRELNKAYIGFKGDDQLLAFKNTIKTGRWGCGAFQGIPQLKFILQWLAASECSKNMIFYRRDDNLLFSAEKIVEVLKGKTVGEIIEVLTIFKENKNEKNLFNFILDNYEKK